MKRIINHDDTISEDRLEEYVKETDLAWKNRNEKRIEAEIERKAYVPPPLPLDDEPEVTFASVVATESSEKKSGFRGRIKSLLSKKTKKKSIPKPLFASYVPPVSPAVPPLPSNGYRSLEYMFASYNYNNGDYENSPEEESDDNASAAFKSSKASIQEKAVTDDAIYDKEKVSFHDKSKGSIWASIYCLNLTVFYI